MAMILHTRIVQLSETDATGYLYFVNQLKWAQEAFLEGLSPEGLKEIFNYPIVHASSDYMAPLKVASEVEIRLWCQSIGRTSFTLVMHVYQKKVQVGGVKLVHAKASVPKEVSFHLRRELETTFSECESAATSLIAEF